MDFTGLDSLIPPIAEAFAKEKTCRFKPLPFAASALLALEMKRIFKRPVVLITESSALMDEMRRNLNAFVEETEQTIFDYPPLEDTAAGKRSDLEPLAELPLADQSLLGQAGRPESLAGARPEVCASLNYRARAQAGIGGQAITTGERLRTLANIGPRCRPFLVNTCVQALMQKTVSPAVLKDNSLRLSPGQEYDPDRLALWLEQAGYQFVPEVQERNQAVRRGGLTDVWPPSESNPVRLEFDGSKIESVRCFDPLDQRSFAKKQDIILTPAKETIPALSGHDSSDSLARYLPANIIFFWTEKHQLPSGKSGRQYSGIAYHADLHEKAAADSGMSKFTLSFRALNEIVAKQNNWQCFSAIECSPWRSPGFPSADLPFIELGFRPLHDIAFAPQSFLTPDVAHENYRRRLAMLEEKARGGMKVHFFFGTQGALDRFRSTAGKSPFHLHLGAISDGFLHDDLRFAVISEPGLLLRTKIMRRHSEIRAQRLAKRRLIARETITDWANIEPGDLVVHINHGIGKYLGLHEIVFNGKLQETIAIEYANRTKLYVPASQAHLLSRYLTAGGRKSKIHQLGGRQWQREKQSAQNAIYDLAGSLLETQALRETLGGFSFPADTVWQHDFEAAFPYEETEDQERAISEVKTDMESPAPMDRLICGDAGYGKTEVALRAAFKAVMAGKQAAVLVPTTVLALQHYEVFQQRMEAYPVRVELLCRFRSASEQQGIVGDLRKGTVDIVIGTHRLLQADLGFKDLGLIIIDEEQRFGVVHKEHLKQLKRLADVLTLTATPIPRTLYLSLTGARKISMIQTPPKTRRPIETIVVKNDDRLLREAILREINRGGQVFYLHNRVATIDKISARLKLIVPEARIAVAHGQMSSRELAEKMHAFGRGLFDVLLCTTIVESGVDLPNVNTILIDRADRFGIADLYQLRGRVGRSDRKAYAYLLTPIHGHLLDISRRRLQAIMEHSTLGSGFKLAMMDLEIRGTGNLLGTEQSGHIAAIGFDLYCQLLRRAIEGLKSGHRQKNIRTTPAETVDVEVNLDFISLAAKNDDLSASAFLPADYVEDEQTRISIYRKIASAATTDEIESLRDEFKDRFGPLPKPFERLLKIAAIRVMAAGKNISAVETRDGKIMFSRRGEYLQIKNQFPRLQATDADGKLKEIASWFDWI